MSELPKPLQAPYSILQQRVETMRAIATPRAFNGSALQQSFQATQQHFQQQILLPSMNLDLPPLVRSAQTEINRILRLLSLDVAFLQSARQPETQSQRLQQVGDRLTRLQEFCDGLLSSDSK